MVGMAGASVAAILTRAPAAGGKSRLFRALGRPADPALLEALLLDTLDGAYAPGISRVVAVEPAAACDQVRAIVPADVEVLPQASGTLGDRMAALMRNLFDRGARAVALLGSDLPDLQPKVVATAFDLLAREPDVLVLGPASDGGYYLIAATAVPPVFEGMEWGSDRVMSDTLAAARARNIRIRRLDGMRDVDTPADLDAVIAPRTAAWRRANQAAD
jgi:rSAM/selenodomain-associated transferase 1